MYYEVYIDVLFLINFMMDYLLLLIVKKFLRCSATHKNITIGSLIGSLLTCVIISAPIRHSFFKLILFHFVVSVAMLIFGLKIREKKELVKALLSLYTGSALMGGIFTYFHQYVKTGSLFFALAVLSYYLVQGAWEFLVCLNKVTEYQCMVTLFYSGESYTVRAVIDTGNSLQDPVTGQPVCVIDESVIMAYEKYIHFYMLREIRFHSVGENNGKISVIRFDRMCVYREKEYWIEEPILALYRGQISSDGGYHMLLNPGIF